jgi:hypothetical protein
LYELSIGGRRSPAVLAPTKHQNVRNDICSSVRSMRARGQADRAEKIGKLSHVEPRRCIRTIERVPARHRD